jgi:hypothetical protein
MERGVEILYPKEFIGTILMVICCFYQNIPESSGRRRGRLPASL